ncbi:HAD family hydrolase [Lentibacillus daqui]|uniref:HAD family hydrolase n=1 Tax=Lentibacillus daqui TaxID=2911514 RepID=UPI0022B1C9A0|nr:HAD family hydrolase [Lentibacillus daqui]
MISYVIWDLGETITTPPPGGMDLKPLNEYPDIKLRKNVDEVLKTINKFGLKNAILSNTARSDSNAVKKLLKRLGVLELFEYVYATQSELDPNIPEKPDAIVYNMVLDDLGIKASDGIMVGNTWDTDIIGANYVGMHSIWLQNPSVSVRKDRETKVNNPPWVIPIWDVDSVPTAIELINSGV